jgi:tripartite-type tricarboxylate transporter receptor subunit TctC
MKLARRNARFAEAPELPTFTEIGLPALSYYQWSGLFAPRGTPEDIISKLNKAAIEALANPAVRSRLAELGFEALSKKSKRHRSSRPCRRPSPRNGYLWSRSLAFRRNEPAARA